MKIKKQVLFIITMIILVSIFGTTNVHAVLQANGTTNSTKSLENWMKSIRYMEALGGTLGLEDSINENNLASNSETSNNLDVHMQKNTEYGAMAILSASPYGNPYKIENGDTTTGNKTGIVININSEYVATSGKPNGIFGSALGKYKNFYLMRDD